MADRRPGGRDVTARRSLAAASAYNGMQFLDVLSLLPGHLVVGMNVVALSHSDSR